MWSWQDQPGSLFWVRFAEELQLPKSKIDGDKIVARPNKTFTVWKPKSSPCVCLYLFQKKVSLSWYLCLFVILLESDLACVPAISFFLSYFLWEWNCMKAKLSNLITPMQSVFELWFEIASNVQFNNSTFLRLDLSILFTHRVEIQTFPYYSTEPKL